MKKINFATIILLIMWAVFLVFGKNAIPYGIRPRYISSLKGILFAPFIHASWQHIIANSLSIFLLTFFLSLFYERIAVISWFLISITADILLWIIGRGNAYHVGASITIFGLIGFLMASGLFRKDIKSFLLTVLVGILFGGALIGILPSNPHISWEGHLSGFISGIFWAYILRNVEANKKDDKNLPDKEIGVIDDKNFEQ